MYTVRAERSGKWWVLQCIEVPGAISQVSRLDQADQIVEAIAWAAGVPESEVEITVEPVIPESTRAHLAAAVLARVTYERAQGEVAAESRAAARELVEAGLTLRDVGQVMGVSHQRAQQLVNSR